MYAKRFILFVMVLLGVELGTQAQYYNSLNRRPNHYITMSLQAGESSTLASSSEVKLTNVPGFQGAFGLAYELRARSFFMSLGGQADFLMHGQQVEKWLEEYERVDRENDDITYAYRYEKMGEKQRNLHLAPFFQMGGYLGKYVYLAAGVKVRFTILNNYDTHVNLTTDGTYHRFIHTIVNDPYYGYYAMDYYKYKASNYWSISQPVVAPMFEIGSKLPVATRSHRISMRVGAYVEYGIPIGWKQTTKGITDYSKVDLNPQTQNIENLKENIIFHSVLTSSWLDKAPQNLSVGVKFTVLFNISRPVTFCNCDNDNPRRRH